MAIKLEGGGGKALVAWPLGDELFFCSFPKQSLDHNHNLNHNHNHNHNDLCS